MNLSVCKAPASYHEYVTERPFPQHAQHRQAYQTQSVGPLPAHAQRTFFRPCSKGGNRPFRAQNGAESKDPGGPRLDRALCIRYLAIISGGQPEHGVERKKGFTVHPSKADQASKHAGPLGTLHAAHVGRGGGGRELGSLS